jgi:hypothetical protein
MQLPCWVRCWFLFSKLARKLSLRDDARLAAYACLSYIIRVTFVAAISIIAVIAAIMIPVVVWFITININK